MDKVRVPSPEASPAVVKSAGEDDRKPREKGERVGLRERSTKNIWPWTGLLGLYREREPDRFV
jgi:hypothetical protein